MNMNSTINETQNAENSAQQSAVFAAVVLVWGPGIILNLTALMFIVRDMKRTYFPVIVLLFMLCLYHALAIIFTLVQHVLVKILASSDGLCGVTTFWFSYFKISSGIINTLMAIDRALAIRTPFFYSRHIKVITWKVVCCVCSFCSVLFSMLPLIGLGDMWSISGSTKLCRLGFQTDPRKRIYGMTYGVLGFVFVGLIVTCNVIVAKTLLLMKRNVVTVLSHDQTTTSNISQNDRVRNQEFELGFAKLMIAISIVYLICGTPTKV